MQLLDINVLIYAHREDSPEHPRYASWLRSVVCGLEPFALSLGVLAGFLRIVTNPRIFRPATPFETALEFCEGLLAQPRAVLLLPSQRHWSLVVKLCRGAGISGPLVSDADLAALAMDHGCELMTTDSDFARFPGLRWRHPLQT